MLKTLLGQAKIFQLRGTVSEKYSKVKFVDHNRLRLGQDTPRYRMGIKAHPEKHESTRRG